MLGIVFLSFVAYAYGGVYAPYDYCNKTEDANMVATMFRKCNPNKDMTYCPQEGWLALFKESDMQNGRKKHYNIINIGFNKGYNFATWLNVFAPSNNVNSKVWYESLTEVHTIDKSDLCGACSDCKAAPFVPTRPVTVGQIEPALHIVGVDLNKHNIDIVTTVMQKLRDTHNISNSRLTLKLLHAAAGSTNAVSSSVTTSNKLKIPKCMAGNELCKIPDPSDSREQQAVTDFEYVDVVGVEDLVQHLMYVRAPTRDNSGRKKAHAMKVPNQQKTHRIPGTDHMVDILHIDTEGNDCEVLKTATETLKAHRVRALIFEYHHYGPWKNTQLKDVVASIELHNMECFFMGQNRLWPISGKCWDPQYEFHDWSNVLCVLRSDQWYQAIQLIVQTATKLRAPFPDGTLMKAHRAAAIYVLQDGKRRGFKNYEAFEKQKFTVPVTSTQQCNILYLFPEGEMIV